MQSVQCRMWSHEQKYERKTTTTHSVYLHNGQGHTELLAPSFSFEKYHLIQRLPKTLLLLSLFLTYYCTPGSDRLTVKMSLRPADGGSAATHASRESCDRQAAYQKPPSGRESCERAPYPAGQKLPAGLHHAPFIFPEGLSSIETLLTNIQVRLCRGFIIIIMLRDEWEGR